MFVKPAEGLFVVDPATKGPMPADGKEVTTNIAYWLRRLACGDVVEAKPVKAPKGAANDVD